MRKKYLGVVLTLIGLSAFVVLGNSPDLVSRIMESFQNDPYATNFFSDDPIEQIIARAGLSRRSSSKEQATLVPAERPESLLWHITFDFTRKIEAKAAEEVSNGSDGRLYSDYFTRQGGLSVENDLILKRTTSEYFKEIEPMEHEARRIIEIMKDSSSGKRAEAMSNELRQLQIKKDEITLRYRDSIKAAFGEGAFGDLVTFLSTDFSEGAKPEISGMAAKPEGIYYEGWSWIIWDDSRTPPLITGFSELYFYYVFPTAPYDPSIDSLFVNLTTNSLLHFRRDDGYRDWIPAQVFHPVFASIRGQRYCTLADHYGILYDGPIPIDEVYLGSTGVCHTVGPAPPPNPSPTPTPNVVSVTLSQVAPSTEPISPNPAVAPHNPGIGLRIFPDDDVPGDMVDRRIVRVTATLSQPIPNVPIYFRNFDLDDPTTDPTIDPDGNDNTDNNGTPQAGQLLFANGCGTNGPSVHCPTNGSGIATIDFVVTRQPGDNFAVAAGVNPIVVNGVTVNGIELVDTGGQTVATENCPTQTVCRSQMLTVWRRLHIEVDSMGQSVQNRAIGTIATTTRIRVGEIVEVPLNPTTPAQLEVNRFEGGRLYANFRSLQVTCNIAAGDTCNTNTSVRVRNPSGSLVTLFAGQTFELYDDDDFNNDDGTLLVGDTGEDISAPDQVMPTGMALLTAASDVEASNVFAPAYIRPVYLTETRDDCLFQSNLASATDREERRAIFRQCWDFGERNTDEEFWYVIVFGAYQFTQETDVDPSTEYGNGVVGIVDAITGVTGDLEGSGALIFMELHRPREIPAYNPNPMDVTSLSNTVAHEVGHLFSCRHGEFGLMGDPNGVPTSSLFTPASISRIRVLMHP